jgi:hypothetical protein
MHSNPESSRLFRVKQIKVFASFIRHLARTRQVTLVTLTLTHRILPAIHHSLHPIADSAILNMLINLGLGILTVIGTKG